jgi:hypothetical protein
MARSLGSSTSGTLVAGSMPTLVQLLLGGQPLHQLAGSFVRQAEIAVDNDNFTVRASRGVGDSSFLID